MQFYNQKKHIRTVMFFDLLLILFIVSFAVFFWKQLCPNGFDVCLIKEPSNRWQFLFLSAIRPFIFTPSIALSFLSFKTFGYGAGFVYALIGNLLSICIVWPIANLLGKNIIAHWLHFHLPKTYTNIRNFDWKIVFLSRLVPFFHFDLLTLIYGSFNLKFTSVFIASFIALIPETLIISFLYENHSFGFSMLMQYFFLTSLMITVPFVLFEYVERKKGSSIWKRVKTIKQEIRREVFLNNAITTRRSHSKEKTPVLLLHGFFASRKSMTILERVLTSKGYEIITFNLGGILGVFFTKGIIESAHEIDIKIKKFFVRNDVNKINIVAHSKGGIVALWWILKLGGNNHCKKVITLGSPFRGTWWTWIALATPLGFFFRDLWQMRPGSNLIKNLNSSEIPPDVKIYNLYSNKDLLVRGAKGIFTGNGNSNKNVKSIAIHFTGHYDMLLRRDVGHIVAKLLTSKDS